MALIELNIPEEEGWKDELTSRILLVLLGALFLRIGFRFWAGVEGTGMAAAVPTFASFALGIQLILLSVVDIDLEQWARPLSYGVAGILTVLVLLTLVLSGSEWLNRLNTDALAFSSYAVELLAAGQNPYTESMRPAWDLFGTGDYWTRRTDGSVVTSVSYPAGSILAYLPQFVLIGRGPIGIRLTSILFVPTIAAVLIHDLPARLSLLGVIALWLPRSQWLTAAGGIVDMLWALPVMIALHFWVRDRQHAGAVALGVACGTKQHPWFILPFLAVWVWHESGSLRAFGRRATTLNAAGLAGFLSLNLPFIVWGPRAWLTSVFTPLGSDGAPLVVEGVGLAVFRLAGIDIPRWMFKAAVVSVMGIGLALYHVYWDELKWTAWLAPMPILLVHSRSLISYFVWFVPICIYCLFALHGRIRDQATPEARPAAVGGGIDE